MIYILTLYFAARLLIGFSRWNLAADAAFITYAGWALWGTTPLALLALPFYLGIAAVGGGVFRYYAGLASALSLSGVYLMFQQAPYLKAFGFVLAILSPAALLPTARDKGSLEGVFRYLVISAFASAFLFIGIGQRGTPLGETFLLLAVALELGVAPMFLWVPDVYGRAHPAGLAILASLPKLSAAFALLAIKPVPPPPRDAPSGSRRPLDADRQPRRLDQHRPPPHIGVLHCGAFGLCRVYIPPPA